MTGVQTCALPISSDPSFLCSDQFVQSEKQNPKFYSKGHEWNGNLSTVCSLSFIPLLLLEYMLN